MSDEDLADLLGITGWRREAMLQVQREKFVPAVGLACPEGGMPYPVDRQERPDEWIRAVYSDTSIITQRDDGNGDLLDINTGLASSSISAPGIALSFLELLQPRDHDQVLEIGTGTGYTAAVLAARLGASPWRWGLPPGRRERWVVLAAALRDRQSGGLVGGMRLRTREGTVRGHPVRGPPAVGRGRRGLPVVGRGR